MCYFFIYFTDFKIKLVHFLSIQNMKRFQFSFFFLKMDPCLLDFFSVFDYSSALIFAPEFIGKNNLLVSKRKISV